ncbi:MAG: hypothetical protein HY918_02205 [Candidatus Doudnabacteria bacterium]|nr:hypothetical protein [Candidatus Doudnabacteria bacterium]
MKNIYVVTHGKKFPGANPGMTEEGFAEVAQLRNLLPAKVRDVVCGTGKRHLDTVKALGLKPTRYTSAVGGPDSGEATVKGGPVDVVRLPCGTLVPYYRYTTLVDGQDGMKSVIAQLRNNSVVCAGRPSMIMLGMMEEDSKSAAVYKVSVAMVVVCVKVGDEPTLRIRIGRVLNIQEVKAVGTSEIHTV